MSLVINSYTQATIFNNLEDIHCMTWISEHQFCDLRPHLEESRKRDLLISLSGCLIRKINDGLVEIGIESEMNI